MDLDVSQEFEEETEVSIYDTKEASIATIQELQHKEQIQQLRIMHSASLVSM